jgi:hypothetical protein
MRISLLMCALVLAGCAGKPSAPTTYVSANGQQLQSAPTTANGTLDPKLLAEARKAGYSLVNTDGRLLYCRTDIKLGTHIRKDTDTVCLTAQEMREMSDRTRQSLDLIKPTPFMCGAGRTCPSP